MKDLIKIMLVLAALFASTFIILKLSGLLTLDDIKAMLNAAQTIHPLYLASVVILLLFADLFIAVPTMTVSIMAGFFLGWPLGAAAAVTGLLLAGVSGYVISRIYGNRLLQRIYKDEARLAEIDDTFSRYGPVVLIVCRAMPILPEVSCCLAGATRMPFAKFITMFSLGTIPYALITTYAGSVSTVDRPTPAIITAIVLSLLLWGGWLLIGRHKAVNERV
ncbi:MAG: VTT domain-containing protein [Candidatus Thiodiazotropha sp.]